MSASKSGLQVKTRALPAWAIALIFIVGLAIGFSAFWFIWKAHMPKAPEVVKTNSPTAQMNGQPPTSTVPLPNASSSTLESSTGTPGEQEFMPLLKPIDNEIKLPIDWVAPKRVDPESVWKKVIDSNASTNDATTSQDLSLTLSSMENTYRAPLDSASDYDAIGTWKLGIIPSGEYQGYVLYEQHDALCNPGGCTDFRFILSPDGKRAISLGNLDMLSMAENSTAPAPGMPQSYLLYNKFMVIAPNFSLDITVVSTTNQMIGGKLLLTAGYPGWGSIYNDWLKTHGALGSYVVLGKTDDGLTIYGKQDGTGCVYIQLPDKNFIQAASKIPEINPGAYSIEGRSVAIKWEPGVKPSKNYMVTAGGCDNFCPILADSKEKLDDADLQKVGTTLAGEPVYAPKDPAHSPTVRAAYDNWFLPDDKPKGSFASFLKKISLPVLFWKDAFGRWVRYSDAVLSPPAECGKPVIYLYPTKTTDVSVALPNFIDVTVSDPAYTARGWQTTARPDGTLTMADGKTYGSLYWEGNGVSYAPQDQGFLVKDGEQVSFLKYALAKYGLNAKESNEFMDFWLPKMTGAPYYRVSFLTDAWSKAAPLFVTPQPDTSIRIFMDWHKLSGPISIAQPKIITPERKGFTLVEWGGLLYSN